MTADGLGIGSVEEAIDISIIYSHDLIIVHVFFCCFYFEKLLSSFLKVVSVPPRVVNMLLHNHLQQIDFTKSLRVAEDFCRSILSMTKLTIVLYCSNFLSYFRKS